jgi:pyrroline-5-carboxylate reductase
MPIGAASCIHCMLSGSLCKRCVLRKISGGKGLLAMLAIRIGFIGAGRMATALARGFVEARAVAADAISASDPSAAARDAFTSQTGGIPAGDDNATVVRGSDVVILAVKPQMMDGVLVGLRDALPSAALVVSIAAGITLERLAAGLPSRQRIVRVMPNTPCLIGRGASCFSLGAEATRSDADIVSTLLAAVGCAYEVPESQLDAVTGLSGSGPAFVYSMIEALTEGGVAAGLPLELAAKLAVKTAAGAAEMLLQTGETPAVLRDRVTSPGGTTLAGLAVLQERRFHEALVAAVDAATRRSAELGNSK